MVWTENTQNKGKGKSGSWRQVKEELNRGCTREDMRTCAEDEDIVTGGGENNEEE